MIVKPKGLKMAMKNSNDNTRPVQNTAKRLAIYPGTFDPITLGHIDVIKRAMSVCDNLIIAIANDSPKKTLFSLAERTKLVESDINQYCPQYKGRIKVEAFTGLLMSFAEKKKAGVIVRGLRAVSDFEYEFQLSAMNSKLNPNIQTIFIPASESTQFIASSLVKEVARLKGALNQFVSKNTVSALKKKF